MKNNAMKYGYFSTYRKACQKYAEVMENTDYQYYIRPSKSGTFYCVERGEKIR